MARYSIFDGNFERLSKKMQRIQKKAEKFGCAFKFEEIGEEYKEIFDENNLKHNLRFIIVDAEGIAKINGWQFVAKIEHTESGNIIRKSVDIEIPEKYYSTDTVCDHCQSKRRRKFTYLIVNEETGEFKQVGKTCLKDFTNGLDAGLIASYIEAFTEIIAGETPNTDTKDDKCMPTFQYLEYAAETIKHFGYLKKDVYSQSRSTAQRAKDYYLSDQQKQSPGKWAQTNLEEMAACGFDAQAEGNAKYVIEALEWLNQQETANDYMNNLKTVCRLPFLSDKHLGLAASLFTVYRKDLDRKAKQQQQAAANSSRWVGEIGQRINIQIANIACVTGWETDWGFTGVYKITDTDNNVFTWKTSNFIPDDAKSIKGTVKNHTEYKGIKQTELTRCSVK